MKLEIKHLAPYLPYGLKAKILDYKSDYVGREIDSIIGIHQWSNDGNLWSVLTLGGAKPSPERIKPLLRPLSRLDKEIQHNGERFVPIEYFEDKYYTLSLHKECERLLEEDGYKWINQMSYLLIIHLLEWNFDIFGLLDAGLAIEITEP
jgi:hypothetical protein